MRRPLVLLAIAVLCLAGAALPWVRPPEEMINEEAERLGAVMQQATARLEQLTDAIAGHLGSDTAANWAYLHGLHSSLEQDGIEVFAYHNGDRYWTGNAPLDPDTLALNGPAHVRSAIGVHLLATLQQGNTRVVALRLVWQQPPMENRFLRHVFHPSLGMPESLVAGMGAGLGPVVRDARGQVMFRLEWRNDGSPSPASPVPVLLLLVAALCLVAAWWSWTLRWGHANERRTWPSIGLFTAGLLALRTLISWLLPSSLVNGMPLFDPALFAASFEPSLGDLLCDVALFLTGAIFIRRRLMPTATAGTWPVWTALLVLLGLALWIDQVMVALVRDSHIPLDLFHIQDLDRYSVIALFLVAFLLLAWLVLAEALVARHASRASVRRLAIAAAVVFGGAIIGAHLLGTYDLILTLWPLPLLILLVLMQRTGIRPGYALLLLAGLSTYTVHMLNRQSLKRTERERNALVEAASSQEDPVIELLFNEAVTDLGADHDMMALLRADSGTIATADLDQRVRQRFFRGQWEQYAVRLHLFGARGQLRGSTSPDVPPTRAELWYRFEQGTPVSGDLSLRNTHRPTETASYIGVVGDPSGAAHSTLFVELLPSYLPEGLGYPELLLPGDRGMEEHFGRFARARYERGALVESVGNYPFPTRWVHPPSAEPIEDQGFDLLATGSVRTKLLVVGMPLPTWMDHATTFSYIFVFFCLLFGAIHLLRASLAGQRLAVSGISAKLRTGILLFAGTALLLFAFGTQRLLGMHTADHLAHQLDERSRSAIAEMRQHIHGEPAIAPDQLGDLDHWLDDASTILLTDLSLYSPQGDLLATSREQLFNSGLLGRRMDPDAYRALAVEGASTFTHDEHIGEASFLTAYRPFLNDQGHVLAYLAVPFFARQNELEAERTTGYVAVANLFVLLFVLSLIAAGLIATWTTRPLLVLRRGLEHVQLGARNEPIAYSGHDELGELVAVYNRKVEELRLSAEKLARSERESAWREMARQVAHEIKNPLTPMKLGIQHFQHTWDPEAPDAKAKLDRFTTSMVEQIDALSRVAGDFSRFAHMGTAHETVLDLNEVAQSAVALFAGEPNADIVLHTAGLLLVKADREHLLRVFNNLIKNAVQAIPEHRRGRIEVRLHALDGQAMAEVKDNGTGIPAEVRERIFTPSFTTKTSGMGLGLAMVQRMVEQAGGSVRFETQVDVGTRFIVSLPLHTAADTFGPTDQVIR